jgi:hypothetical protein
MEALEEFKKQAELAKQLNTESKLLAEQALTANKTD